MRVSGKTQPHERQFTRKAASRSRGWEAAPDGCLRGLCLPFPGPEHLWPWGYPVAVLGWEGVNLRQRHHEVHGGARKGSSPAWSLPLSGHLLRPQQLPSWRPRFTRKATRTPAAGSRSPAQDTSAARTPLRVPPVLRLPHLPDAFPTLWPSR